MHTDLDGPFSFWSILPSRRFNPVRSDSPGLEQPLLVAAEAQAGPEAQADLPGQRVAQLGEEGLGGRVLHVGVHPQGGDAPAPGLGLRLGHQGQGNAAALGCRVHGQAVDYDFMMEAM